MEASAYPSSFYDGMSLGEARDLLRVLVEDGHECPLCHQFAKVYRRRVTSSMVRTLTRMWRMAGQRYVYLPEVPQDSRDSTHMAHFGLIEEMPFRREDGGRAGWWRVTDLGERFLHRAATIPKYAHVYDAKRLRFSGDPVGIDEALGKKFDLGELMGWREGWEPPRA